MTARSAKDAARTDLGWLVAKPIAHRGLHDLAAGVIENSPSAAQAAIAAGFGIECDVQLTADGEAVVFDETFIHYAENKTDQNRIILFADVERPMRYRWAQAINHAVGGFLLRAAAAPNQEGDRTGGINRIFGTVYAVRHFGKAIKKKNETLYYILKWLLVLGIAALIFL